MAVGDARVFPGFLTPVLTQLSFQSHRLLFSHASAEVQGENTLERKFASAGERAHNHQSDTLTTEPPGQGPKTSNNILLTEPCFGKGNEALPFSQNKKHVFYLSAVQVF